MNDCQIVSDLQFLDLENLLYTALFCHVDFQSKALTQQRIYRGSGLGRLYLPLHQYMLMLFDGERHCTVVAKPVFFFQAFSLPIWLHTWYVLSLVSVMMKNI